MTIEGLAARLIETVADEKSWAEALASICAHVGARSALISLRHGGSAEIVVPGHVAREHASPLLFGFSEEAVAAYLEHYSDVDPWTQIENANLPRVPYAMSAHLSLADLRQTPFWPWLAPQGIDDCIVCALDETDGDWTSINLYFATDGDTERVSEMLDRFGEIMPLLRAAWAAGRTAQNREHVSDALEMALDAMPNAAALVSRDGLVLATNAAARDLSAQAEFTVRRNKPLALPEDLSREIGPNADITQIINGPPCKWPGRAVFNLATRSETLDGKRVDRILLTIDPPALWDLPTLSPRERQLVQLVAEGKTFRQAADTMGRTLVRVMQLWRSARDKLALADVHDLRMRHRIAAKTCVTKKPDLEAEPSSEVPLDS